MAGASDCNAGPIAPVWAGTVFELIVFASAHATLAWRSAFANDVGKLGNPCGLLHHLWSAAKA